MAVVANSSGAELEFTADYQNFKVGIMVDYQLTWWPRLGITAWNMVRTVRLWDCLFMGAQTPLREHPVHRRDWVFPKVRCNFLA